MKYKAIVHIEIEASTYMSADYKLDLIIKTIRKLYDNDTFKVSFVSLEQ